MELSVSSGTGMRLFRLIKLLKKQTLFPSSILPV